MAFDLSEYKYTYNVAECAGITEAKYDKAMYKKIADWVNSDRVLSKLFTANVESPADNTYRLLLKGYDGRYGFTYGYYSSSYTDQTNLVSIAAKTEDYSSINYSESNMSTSKTTIDVMELCIVAFVSLYGTYVSIYPKTTPETRLTHCIAYATGEDGSNLFVRIGGGLITILSSIYTQRSCVINATHSYYTAPSCTGKTRTSSFLTRMSIWDSIATGYTADGMYYVDGAQLGLNQVYEIDGGYYVIAYTNSGTYKGAALKLE